MRVKQHIQAELPDLWRCTMKKYFFQSAGLPIHSFRYCYHLQYTTDTTSLQASPVGPTTNSTLPVIRDYIDTFLNIDDNACPIIIPNEAMSNNLRSTNHPIEVAFIQPVSGPTTPPGYIPVLSPDGLPVEPDPTTFNDFTRHRFAVLFRNSAHLDSETSIRCRASRHYRGGST